jgi:peptidyl-prolyl cis-trans isomerase C
MHHAALEHPEATGECGSGHCGCGSAVTDTPPAALPAAALPEVRIDGKRLHIGPGETLEAVRERAWAELLRQEAVRQGRLADDGGALAPALSAEQQQAIEAMLEVAVQTPEPTAEACARYHEAHKPRFTQGQQACLRHILFAVTPGVPVQALAQRAEAALLELMHPDTPPERFAQLAAALSNCPSGAQGGALGWLGPQDCAPELAQFLFFKEGGVANGLQPRLVHSRFGLHIVDVQAQRAGTLAPLAQVHTRIAGELALRSRATALRQYMLLLVGRARIEGIELEGADTPLVQ